TSYLRLFSTAPATTQTYPLSLHDALPIFVFTPRTSASRCICRAVRGISSETDVPGTLVAIARKGPPVSVPGLGSHVSSWLAPPRSEEHTSELQSRGHLVCRLLLEKKNKYA